MNHVKFAPRVLAMGLLAASALSIPAFAAPGRRQLHRHPGGPGPRPQLRQPVGLRQ